MYRVICPVDFSDVSKNALLYAVHLLNDLGAGHLQVLHCYELPSATGHERMMNEAVRSGAQKDMETVISVTTPWLGPNETIDYAIHTGDCPEHLNKIANERKYDLIVLGSESSAQRMKIIFGSTTKEILNQVEMPTLVVPDQVKYEPLKNIVLAIEDKINPETFQVINRLGKTHMQHLSILHVGDINIGKREIDYYGQLMGDYSYSFHNIEGDDVINGINGFVEDIDADLLVMEKHKRKFFQKIFRVSHTNLELFEARIPLLVLHE